MIKLSGSQKIVLLLGILITICVLIFIINAQLFPAIYPANPDDLQIILSDPIETENPNMMTIKTTIENRRDHSVHLDGGFSWIITVNDSLNKSDTRSSSIWIENHAGENWGPNYKKEFLIKIYFSPNFSEVVKNYQIQARFTFSDPGGSEKDGISVYSNIIMYNTEKSIIDTGLE